MQSPTEQFKVLLPAFQFLECTPGGAIRTKTENFTSTRELILECDLVNLFIKIMMTTCLQSIITNQ
jgi:hypothetical protein